MAALCDDLNTPKALAEVYDLLGVLNRATTTEEQAKAKGALLAAGALLGLFQADPEVWLCGAGTGEEEGLAARVEDLICQRKAARQARDFARADAIRDELTQAGIVLEDGPNGTTWRKA